MQKLLFSLVLLFNVGFAYAQSQLTTLSDKHISKVERGSSAKDKLKLYKKFYSKDSLKQVRQFEKYWQGKSDSLLAAVQEKENQLNGKANELLKRASRKLNKRLAKLNLSNKKLDTLNLKLDTLNAGVIPDSLLSGKVADLKGKADMNLPEQSDALNEVGQQTQNVKNKMLQNSQVTEVKELTGKAKDITNEAKAYQQDFIKYQGKAESYLKNDSLLKADVKSLVSQEAQSRAMGFKELKALEDIKKQQENFDPRQNEYKQQMDQLQDSAYRKEQARKKAEEMVMNYIAENPAMMKAAKAKTDLLMKKYSIVPNSNDLSTAVKRTSLEGRSFKERLYLAGNFQVLSFKPVSFDFSPMVGYRFSTRLTGGLGVNYRKTFADSVTSFAADMLGYKAFVSYDVFRSFFAYSEFANNSMGIVYTENGTRRNWSHAFLIGAGRKFTLHPKVEMTVVMLYNVGREPGDPVYPNPWVVRFGFQLSELAFRKPTLAGSN